MRIKTYLDGQSLVLLLQLQQLVSRSQEGVALELFHLGLEPLVLQLQLEYSRLGIADEVAAHARAIERAPRLKMVQLGDQRGGLAQGVLVAQLQLRVLLHHLLQPLALSIALLWDTTIALLLYASYSF